MPPSRSSNSSRSPRPSPAGEPAHRRRARSAGAAPTGCRGSPRAPGEREAGHVLRAQAGRPHRAPHAPPEQPDQHAARSRPPRAPARRRQRHAGATAAGRDHRHVLALQRQGRPRRGPACERVLDRRWMLEPGDRQQRAARPPQECRVGRLVHQIPELVRTSEHSPHAIEMSGSSIDSDARRAHAPCHPLPPGGQCGKPRTAAAVGFYGCDAHRSPDAGGPSRRSWTARASPATDPRWAPRGRYFPAAPSGQPTDAPQHPEREAQAHARFRRPP